ncbi:hypothetical protein Deipr_1892 [Deinococcus proteolyticus MRP]|uniref:Uncharacterized protein n=1 Tax=Deinococcus proteolyticus (strain ATCC 35074 / DSM 20540 / JCM 6276 / NBRC 101906 / NCIMB 13154 / VKM Ac-1939 / CCM 2703 / MRP) TaxID=693977 RepID=F0RM14_DEIPM|nr:MULTISPECIES: hypothetical protein [Deinococcus]ADY27024.1 hypothetical protein Deipr_1892 [Deinococcus proteolyticus MRP]MCY1703148.1 hypothetical protein [Deinococcus sp. SL84]
MKPSLSAAAAALEGAEQAYAAGHTGRAGSQLDSALDQLLRLRPSALRDTLLAQTHLRLHVLAQASGQLGRSERHLRWGVSYARTAGDGPTRTLAQQLWNDWQAGRT